MKCYQQQVRVIQFHHLDSDSGDIDGHIEAEEHMETGAIVRISG